jgi:hypothetical protein
MRENALAHMANPTAGTGGRRRWWMLWGGSLVVPPILALLAGDGSSFSTSTAAASRIGPASGASLPNNESSDLFRRIERKGSRTLVLWGTDDPIIPRDPRT